MRKLVFFFLLTLSLSTLGKAQSLNWTSFENLSDSLRAEKRPLLIFIHTSWCKYCQLQENTTFSNSGLVADLNQNFYSLKLNTEDKEDIEFLNRNYRYQTAKGNHKLAEWLGMQNNELIFPTTVIIHENFQTILRLQGLQTADNLIPQIRRLIKP